MIRLILYGLTFYLVNAQLLTTKCPSSDWTQYKERCYLVTGFQHSWSKANGYCKHYGARLVEPSGYVINDAVVNQVKSKLPSAEKLWTGYNRLTSSSQATHIATWSNGDVTSVDVGVWGLSEPDTSDGKMCAYVSTADWKWYMGPCDLVLPFVCEMDPCPADSRDTFMCNGKCLGNTLKCDGTDDCGNNLDEQNCPTQCRYTYQSDTGEITLSTPQAGQYQSNQDCTWLIETTPGTRINIEFETIGLEEKTDFLEIWDGGLSMGTSQLSQRISGTHTAGTLPVYTSSYNFALLRFVSDATTQMVGFKVKWSTAHSCPYNMLDGYTLTNTEAEYDNTVLPPLENTAKCNTECTGSTECLGFRYDEGTRTCFFFRVPPVIQTAASSQIFTRTCLNGLTIQASLPVRLAVMQASSTPGYLTTPLYPSLYIGHLELDYTIQTTGNYLITLQVLSVDLCCGDNVFIYDKSMTLLETLGSSSAPHLLISTDNTVYIRMVLTSHWKCKGAYIEYKRDCRNTFTGSGSITSPGYGTVKSYPGLSLCTWRINAPSATRSVTVRFEEFQLDTGDEMKITYGNGTQEVYGTTSLQGASVTSQTYLELVLDTSSRDSLKGFKLTYSPGCPNLQSESYTLSSNNSNYGDTVTVTCATGHTFTGQYSGQTSVQLECGLSGNWNVPDLPECAQGFCGPPPFLSNGYINSSTGIQGGDTTKYSCNEGYSLQGASEVTCLASNTWETLPSCTSVQCARISTLASSTATDVVYGDSIQHGSVAELSCPLYQEIIGAPRVQCKVGSWDFVTDANPSICQGKVCTNGGLPVRGLRAR